MKVTITFDTENKDPIRVLKLLEYNLQDDAELSSSLEDILDQAVWGFRVEANMYEPPEGDIA